MRFNMVLALIAATAFLVSFRATPVRASCPDDRPVCNTCPELTAVWGEGFENGEIAAWPEPWCDNDPTLGCKTVCREDQNPPGSETWDAEAWAGFLHLRTIWLEDRDLRTRQYGWHRVMPGCGWREEGEDVWAWQYGGDLVTIWSGSVDLTQVGTYTMYAAVTEFDPETPPCFCPPAIDEPKILCFTINVVCCDCNDNGACVTTCPPGKCCDSEKNCVDCCACSDCPGVVSDWQDLPNTQGACLSFCDWEEEPVVDECGNTLQLTCSGGAYHLKFNRVEVGTCVWRWGENEFKYRILSKDCGWKIYDIFHRTQDTYAALPSTHDCGTIGKYDWLDNFIVLCGEAPCSQCCASESDPGANPDAPCPSEGDCDNTANCWTPPPPP